MSTATRAATTKPTSKRWRKGPRVSTGSMLSKKLIADGDIQQDAKAIGFIVQIIDGFVPKLLRREAISLHVGTSSEVTVALSRDERQF
jgi:hypothetical protein